MLQQECLIERVRRVVIRALRLPITETQIGFDDPLFGGDATVDSIGSLEIIAALEVEFGIHIEDDELRLELFDSIRTLTECVRQHLQATTCKQATACKQATVR